MVIFAKSIYDELDETIIKKGNKNEKGNVKSIQDIISLIKKIENKFYNRREIIDYIKQIGKVINLNNKRTKKEEEKEEKNKKIFKKICFSGNIYNTEKVLEYDLKNRIWRRIFKW